jgi:ATPase family AAA domain-containing protein 2
MPPSRNPTLEEVVMQEDSDDDDYDDKETIQSRSRSKKRRQQGRPSGKRQRTRRGSDDDDLVSDEDEDDLGNASFSEAEHAPEVVERSSAGRPLRNAAKVPKQYEEPPSSEEDNDDSPYDSDDAPKMPAKKTVNRRLIVKLKTGTTPVPPARNLQTRSSSLGGKRPATSSDQHPRGTRRSSRIAHDDEETVVALTNSGNHVEIVRAGSKDPEGIPARAMRGGKGLKYPSKSTIDEEEDSGRTKEEIVEELEIQASQHEIHESDPQTQGDYNGSMPRLVSDLHTAAEDSADELAIHEETEAVLDTGNEEEGDDEDDGPMVRGRTRAAGKRKAEEPPDEPQRQIKRLRGKSLKKTGSKRPTRRGMDESSDFAPENDQEGDDDLSESSQSEGSPRKEIQRMDDNNSSSNGRRSARLRKQDQSKLSGDSEEEQAELAEEMADLEADRRQRRRRRPVEILYEDTARSLRGPRAAAVGKDYRLLRPELNIPIEDLEDEPSHTPSRRGRGGGGGGGGGGWQRSLFSTYGPFGGAGGLAPVLGGPGGAGAAGGVDSDSSDDEVMQKPKPVGGVVGMTPTSLMPSGGFPFFPTAQTLNADPAQAATGTPANLGKIKDKQALADADPLGVDQNVNFDGVGGLHGHIDQLKEMVSLPLLYPEIFMRFHITPPRGVLFHGPPGTGKTLLARALASSVSSQGKKVTFYMRKGADALSKWVGEAERQLRLLFEEARKNQPSIIFFDEIDGMSTAIVLHDHDC